MAIEHHFIGGLAPESSLWAPTRSRSGKPKWSLVHLGQAELDGGCGLFCLLMSLMILLRLSRSEVLKLTSAKRGPLAALWREARTHYFQGTDGKDLIQYVAAFGGALSVERHSGSAARMVKAATAAVLASQAPLLRVIGRNFDHWVLLSGIERLHLAGDTYRTLALLALDPGERPPFLSAHTGRIDIEPRVHRRTAQQVSSRSYSYRSLSGDCVNVRLTELLVLRLAQAP